MKIGFYLLGKKGYIVLTEFQKKFGSGAVAFVMCAKDMGVDNDYFNEISGFCLNEKIPIFSRQWNEPHGKPFADYYFAIGWRWIIKRSENLMIFHDSLLPKYRGFAPLVNMLIDGVQRIGVTALRATHEYDKGDIINQASIEILYPLKIRDAIDLIVPLYTKLVLTIFETINSGGSLKCTSQNETEASYSLWRDEADYLIDWSDHASRIRRFCDAVGVPYGGASSFMGKDKVRILDVEEMEDVAVENRLKNIGKVIFVVDGQPVVVCGAGLLKISNIEQIDGKSLVGNIPFRTRFTHVPSLDDDSI